MTILINKPSYQEKLKRFRKGGQIPKFQSGGLVPPYFKIYGIDPSKFKSMFSALRSRGLSNQVAFEITWQSMKEKPKSFYSFGSTFNNVDAWANDVVNYQLKRNIYKNARNARNYDEYRRATLPYNRNPGYTKWLQEGRDQGKGFINQYIKDNKLGQLVVMNDFDSNESNYVNDYTT